MAVHDPGRRMGAIILAVLALVLPCAVVGCGGAGGDSPAPVDSAQVKKAQSYMSNYREQIIADNKAKAKAKAEGKKSP